jgi:hypothetical protein
VAKIQRVDAAVDSGSGVVGVNEKIVVAADVVVLQSDLGYEHWN